MSFSSADVAAQHEQQRAALAQLLDAIKSLPAAKAPAHAAGFGLASLHDELALVYGGASDSTCLEISGTDDHRAPQDNAASDGNVMDHFAQLLRKVPAGCDPSCGSLLARLNSLCTLQTGAVALAWTLNALARRAWRGMLPARDAVLLPGARGSVHLSKVRSRARVAALPTSKATKPRWFMLDGQFLYRYGSKPPSVSLAKHKMFLAGATIELVDASTGRVIRGGTGLHPHDADDGIGAGNEVHAGLQLSVRICPRATPGDSVVVWFLTVPEPTSPGHSSVLCWYKELRAASEAATETLHAKLQMQSLAPPHLAPHKSPRPLPHPNTSEKPLVHAAYARVQPPPALLGYCPVCADDIFAPLSLWATSNTWPSLDPLLPLWLPSAQWALGQPWSSTQLCLKPAAPESDIGPSCELCTARASLLAVSRWLFVMCAHRGGATAKNRPPAKELATIAVALLKRAIGCVRVRYFASAALAFTCGIADGDDDNHHSAAAGAVLAAAIAAKRTFGQKPGWGTIPSANDLEGKHGMPGPMPAAADPAAAAAADTALAAGGAMALAQLLCTTPAYSTDGCDACIDIAQRIAALSALRSIARSSPLRAFAVARMLPCDMCLGIRSTLSALSALVFSETSAPDQANGCWVWRAALDNLVPPLTPLSCRQHGRRLLAEQAMAFWVEVVYALPATDRLLFIDKGGLELMLWLGSDVSSDCTGESAEYMCDVREDAEQLTILLLHLLGLGIMDQAHDRLEAAASSHEVANGVLACSPAAQQLAPHQLLLLCRSGRLELELEACVVLSRRWAPLWQAEACLASGCDIDDVNIYDVDTKTFGDEATYVTMLQSLAKLLDRVLKSTKSDTSLEMTLAIHTLDAIRGLGMRLLLLRRFRVSTADDVVGAAADSPQMIEPLIEAACYCCRTASPTSLLMLACADSLRARASWAMYIAMHGCVALNLLLDNTAGTAERIHRIFNALGAAVQKNAMKSSTEKSETSPQRKYSFPGARTSGNSRCRARSLDVVDDAAQLGAREKWNRPQKNSSPCIAQSSRSDAVAPLAALLCEAANPFSTVLCNALEANASRWLPEKDITNLAIIFMALDAKNRSGCLGCLRLLEKCLVSPLQQGDSDDDNHRRMRNASWNLHAGGVRCVAALTGSGDVEIRFAALRVLMALCKPDTTELRPNLDLRGAQNIDQKLLLRVLQLEGSEAGTGGGAVPVLQHVVELTEFKDDPGHNLALEMLELLHSPLSILRSSEGMDASTSNKCGGCIRFLQVEDLLRLLHIGTCAQHSVGAAALTELGRRVVQTCLPSARSMPFALRIDRLSLYDAEGMYHTYWFLLTENILCWYHDGDWEHHISAPAQRLQERGAIRSDALRAMSAECVYPRDLRFAQRTRRRRSSKSKSANVQLTDPLITATSGAARTCSVPAPLSVARATLQLDRCVLQWATPAKDMCQLHWMEQVPGQPDRPFYLQLAPPHMIDAKDRSKEDVTQDRTLMHAWYKAMSLITRTRCVVASTRQLVRGAREPWNAAGATGSLNLEGAEAAPQEPDLVRALPMVTRLGLALITTNEHENLCAMAAANFTAALSRDCSSARHRLLGCVPASDLSPKSGSVLHSANVFNARVTPALSMSAKLAASCAVRIRRALASDADTKNISSCLQCLADALETLANCADVGPVESTRRHTMAQLALRMSGELFVVDSASQVLALDHIICTTGCVAGNMWRRTLASALRILVGVTRAVAADATRTKGTKLLAGGAGAMRQDSFVAHDGEDNQGGHNSVGVASTIVGKADDSIVDSNCAQVLKALQASDSVRAICATTYAKSSEDYDPLTSNDTARENATLLHLSFELIRAISRFGHDARVWALQQGALGFLLRHASKSGAPGRSGDGTTGVREAPHLCVVALVDLCGSVGAGCALCTEANSVPAVSHMQLLQLLASYALPTVQLNSAIALETRLREERGSTTGLKRTWWRSLNILSDVLTVATANGMIRENSLEDGPISSGDRPLENEKQIDTSDRSTVESKSAQIPSPSRRRFVSNVRRFLTGGTNVTSAMFRSLALSQTERRQQLVGSIVRSLTILWQQQSSTGNGLVQADTRRRDVMELHTFQPLLYLLGSIDLPPPTRLLAARLLCSLGTACRPCAAANALASVQCSATVLLAALEDSAAMHGLPLDSETVHMTDSPSAEVALAKTQRTSNHPDTTAAALANVVAQLVLRLASSDAGRQHLALSGGGGRLIAFLCADRDDSVAAGVRVAVKNRTGRAIAPLPARCHLLRACSKLLAEDGVRLNVSIRDRMRLVQYTLGKQCLGKAVALEAKSVALNCAHVVLSDDELANALVSAGAVKQKYIISILLGGAAGASLKVDDSDENVIQHQKGLVQAAIKVGLAILKPGIAGKTELQSALQVAKCELDKLDSASMAMSAQKQCNSATTGPRESTGEEYPHERLVDFMQFFGDRIATATVNVLHNGITSTLAPVRVLALVALVLALGWSDMSIAWVFVLSGFVGIAGQRTNGSDKVHIELHLCALLSMVLGVIHAVGRTGGTVMYTFVTVAAGWVSEIDRRQQYQKRMIQRQQQKEPQRWQKQHSEQHQGSNIGKVTGELPLMEHGLHDIAWIQFVLDSCWNALNIASADAILWSVQPLLDAAVPMGPIQSLRIEELDFGRTAPRVSALRRPYDGAAPNASTGTAMNESTEAKDTAFEVDLHFDAVAPRIVIKVELSVPPLNTRITVPLELTRLRVAGTLRLKFRALIPVFPLFSALSVAFVRPPLLSLALRALRLDVMSVPLLSTYLEHLIRDIIHGCFVLPNEVTAPDWRGQARTYLRDASKYVREATGNLRVDREREWLDARHELKEELQRGERELGASGVKSGEEQQQQQKQRHQQDMGRSVQPARSSVTADTVPVITHVRPRSSSDPFVTPHK